MNNLGSYFLLVFISSVILFALFKRVKVFDCFTEGAKDGIKTALSILPSMIALVVAVNMLSSSGVLSFLSTCLSPVAEFLGIPKDLVPLCLISPISGSGSLAVFENILENFGPDSYIGRVASVISGSTETTFYAIAIYFGAIGIKKTRHTVIASLCADTTSFLLAALFVKLFFYQ